MGIAESSENPSNPDPSLTQMIRLVEGLAGVKQLASKVAALEKRVEVLGKDKPETQQGEADLLKSAAAFLEQRGYASEMKALQTFLKGDWWANGSPAYLDRESHKTREYDVFASLSHSFSDGPGDSDEFTSVETNVIAEVKKGAPWVVFREPEPWSSPHRARPELIYIHDPAKRISGKELPFQMGALHRRLDWWAYGICEPFKGERNRTDDSWAAFHTVVKAAAEHLETLKTYPQEVCRVAHIRRAVIFDGILLSAALDQNGDVVVERVEMAPVCFQYNSPEYPVGQVQIDVVSLSGLPSYQQFCGRQHERIVECVRARQGKSYEPDPALKDESPPAQ